VIAPGASGPSMDTVSSAAWPVRCSNCGRGVAPGALDYRCRTCGGFFDLETEIVYAASTPPGVGSRPRSVLPVPEAAPWITLGEGGTPLVAGALEGRTVHFKCEYLNPTGSFKDRGTTVLMSILAGAGVREAIEDSSGNAGASFAAYAARAGIRVRVFVPEGASARKLAQIEAYGAEIVRVSGPRSGVAEAARREADQGAVYASHVWLPFGMAGFATMAFEIVEALGAAPAGVVVPAGHGTLLLGLARGFDAMIAAGMIDRKPRMVAAQAAACAPLWAAYQGGGAAVGWVREGETRAEGIRILQPLRGDSVLREVQTSGGTIIAVDEPSILRGEAELARRGFFVEPTSAVVWSALESTLGGLADPVVAVLTGSGLKAEPVAMRNHV